MDYGWKVCALNTFVNSNVSSTESAEKLEQLRALNLGMKISYGKKIYLNLILTIILNS